jgi:monoamine oxidase
LARGQSPWPSLRKNPCQKLAKIAIPFHRHRIVTPNGNPALPAPAAMVADTLAQVEPILPGISAAWAAGPQRAWVNDRNIDPFIRGAWSNFLVGQYTSFAGAQSLRAGNLHFAGEHTSLEFQGFMEGG